MQALLEGDATRGLSSATWAKLIAGLALSAALLAWPLIQIQIAMLFCIDRS
jgi:hypothetical protein